MVLSDRQDMTKPWRSRKTRKIRPTMEANTSCFVSNGMCVYLRLARVCGLAPLQFRRDGAGWRAAPCRRAALYGHCIIAIIIPLQPPSSTTSLHQQQQNNQNTSEKVHRDWCDRAAEIYAMQDVLHSYQLREASAIAKLMLLRKSTQEIKHEKQDILTLASVFRELQLPPEGTVRMRTQTRRIIYVAQTVFMVVSSLGGAYNAPAHARHMIACFNHVKKINAELNIVGWPPCVNKRAVAVLVSQAVACVLLSLINYVQIVLSAQRIQEESWINAVSCYFLVYWVVQVQSVQFVLLVLHVRYSFIQLNKQLHSILQDLEKPKDMLPELNRKQYNNYVRFGNVIKANADVWKADVVDSAGTVRRLALVYAALCGAVRGVDVSHGGTVLLLLANILVHLVCTPYYFIVYLLDDEAAASLTALNMVAIVTQVLWCVYHVLCVVVIVEPCHLTHIEMRGTRQLVGRLCGRCRSPHEALAGELDLLFRYLTLNNVRYEPLKFATMNRALIFTLLGSITTYTVVILHI